MRVSPCIVFPRTHIPRDACFPAHISLMSYVLQVIVIRVSPGIMFPVTVAQIYSVRLAGYIVTYLAAICMHAYM